MGTCTDNSHLCSSYLVPSDPSFQLDANKKEDTEEILFDPMKQVPNFRRTPQGEGRSNTTASDQPANKRISVKKPVCSHFTPKSKFPYRTGCCCAWLFCCCRADASGCIYCEPYKPSALA